MTLLHDALAAVFAVLLDPLGRFGPLAALTIVSAVSGAILIVAFRFTSRPHAIRAARRRVQANLLAVRIFRDDLGVVMRAQQRVFAALGAYTGNMLIPFLAMLVPFALVFAQLDARYGSRALRPGEAAVVTTLTDGASGEWRLEGSEGVAVETPPVRIPARREIAWRVRGSTSGEHRLALVAGERRVEKELRVSSVPAGASPRRLRAGFEALFLAPSEPTLDPASGLGAVEIHYPPLRLEALGWQLHWIVVFLVVSFVVALALRRRVGAEI